MTDIGISVDKEFVESIERAQNLARDSFVEMFGEEPREYLNPVFAALSSVQAAVNLCMAYEDLQGYQFFRACTWGIFNRTEEYFSTPKKAQ